MAARNQILPLPEAPSRQLWALRSIEREADSHLWTAADRRWATQLARESLGAGAEGDSLLIERARHAMQRLQPRLPGLQAWLEEPERWWRAAMLALAAALIAGALIDHIGAHQRINLLAPPVWLVVVWNLAVYLGLALPRPGVGGWLRRMLQHRVVLRGMARASPPLRRIAADWAQVALPLWGSRAAAILHAAAATLALGLVAGLYLRGLVLDYRAGWQSTFLEAGSVQVLLQALFAPAAALTGIAVPAVGPLRVLPEQPPTGDAAPWLHLYSATLLLFVIVPRLALAAWSALRAARLERALPLPVAEPYFAQLRAALSGATMRVEVATIGVAAAPAQVLALQRLVNMAWGEGTELHFAAPVGAGDEDRADGGQGASLVLASFDMNSTPEAEHQGRVIAALRARAAAAPVLALVDTAAFTQRFAALPDRLAQRCETWKSFAQAQGLHLVFAQLDGDDHGQAEAAAALRDALAQG